MLPSLAERIAARPLRILVAVLAFVALAAVAGGPVVGLLEAGDGFTDPDSESARAVERIEDATGRAASTGVVLLVRPDGDVRSADGRAQIEKLADQLGEVPGIAAVESFADRGDPRFVSRDGAFTYVAGTLSSSADEDAVVEAVQERFGDRAGVQVGGSAVANHQLSEQISEDLKRAELLAFPILIVLSLVFFRGVRAATLPLSIGVTTVLGTFLVLRLVNGVYELSVFSLNLVIGLGLGLAIDYALFLLTRYREELDRSGPGAQAIKSTMATAGRTVLFSAATVATALATLIVFPLNFLKSMAIGGAAVAIMAALAASIMAPAFFALWNVKLRARERRAAHNRWDNVARRVMARPGAIAVLTAIAMLALALPAFRAEWTPVDIGTVPKDLSARQVGDALARDFPRQDSNPLMLVVPGSPDAAPEVRELASQVAALPGVAGVNPPEPVSDSTWRVDALVRGDAAGEVARETVETIRASSSGPVDPLVAGEAAAFIDQQDAISSRLVLAMLLLAGFTAVVLWLMTGSVVLPLKAIVMNALTVGATLGILTLVFQDGRLEGLLGYTSNGGIEPTDFLVTATLVFALSTDYGVFLLGRIKEAHDAGLSDREAVASGLARTGAVVTAAAVLLAVAIGAFVTSEVIFIKQIGIGAALGVLIDAFVVRALLVPSLMALLGRWNWWSPSPLRRLHARVGIREEASATSS